MKDQEYTPIGEKALIIMQEKGLRVADIARATGLTPSAVAKWLKVSDIRVSTLIKLSEVLGVSPSYLLGGETRTETRIICPHCGESIQVQINLKQK